MFAFVNPDEGSMIQGWLDINYGGMDILDVLNKWKNGIPEQKQRIAFDMDIKGRMSGARGLTFENFADELRAFDRLEHRIEEAIAEELSARAARQQRVDNLLSGTDVLVLPGDDGIFHPTTRAAFTEDELTAVQSGKALTKIIEQRGG